MALYVDTPAFREYRWVPGHPFDPLRLVLTRDLLEEMGLLEPEEVVAPDPIDDEVLTEYHTPAYIEAVREMGRTGQASEDAERFGLNTEDDPVFVGMHEAARWYVAGTLFALRLILSGRDDHVLNLGGGLHHAKRSNASGFCIYNDAAVAIRHILREQPQLRVAYIDIDAHHADGVQDAFYADPQVLVISFHETGRYLFPGTGAVNEQGIGAGYGTTVNVPLDAFTEDDSYLLALQEVVPPLLEAFHPDILVTQHGADAHRADPLSHLAVTTAFYIEAAKQIDEWAHRYTQGRWVALGGGGYEKWFAVPRAWAALWAQMRHTPLSPGQPLPKTWLDRWTPKADVEPATTFSDTYPPIPRRSQIEATNEMTLYHVLSTAPLLRGVGQK
ncbi:MAG: acetoin utilization protein AcuC [Firmicutes bacterium]|nr:acetoin utilization protein AcuC [Bacillota bacterium]